jgi:hypothetical protein
MFKINNFNFISVLPDNENKNEINKNEINKNEINKNSMISNNLNLLLVLPQEIITEIMKLNLNYEKDFEKLKTLMYLESHEVNKNILDDEEYLILKKNHKLYEAKNLEKDEILWINNPNKQNKKIILIKSNFSEDRRIYLNNLNININELNHIIYKTFQYCKNNSTNIKMINYYEFINLNHYKYNLYNHILLFEYVWLSSKIYRKKIEDIKSHRSHLDILILNKIIINTKYSSNHKINFINENMLLEYFEKNIKKQLNFYIN